MRSRSTSDRPIEVGRRLAHIVQARPAVGQSVPRRGEFGEDDEVDVGGPNRFDDPVSIFLDRPEIGNGLDRRDANRWPRHSQIPPDIRSIATITTTVSPMNTTLAEAITGG